MDWGLLRLSANGKPPKIIPIVGELRTHQWLLSRLHQALTAKDFSLTVIFPTLSLLQYIQDELLNQPGIRGIGGVHFFLFEGFIEEIVKRFGLNQRQPSMLVRNLLIARCFQKLAAEGKMDCLNRAPFTSSYRQAILQGIAEWKRSCLTPEIFGEWAEGRGGKEQELALLYRSYQELLSETGYTEADFILTELQAAEGERMTGQPAPVILYGFTDLTPLQNSLIHHLTGFFDFEIILDPTYVADFRELSTHYFQIPLDIGGLWQDIGESGITKDDSSKPDPGNALQRLQESFWRREPEKISLDPDDNSLGLIQAAGVIRQATGIARELTAIWKANPSFEPGDFLILAPDPANFLRTAIPVFKEYGLILPKPKRPVTEFPWVNQLINLLGAAGTGWQWKEMEVIIRQYYRTEKLTGDRLLFIVSQRYGAVSGRERWLKLSATESFRQYFQELGINLEPLSEALRHLAAIPDRGTLKVYLQAVRKIMAEYVRPQEMILHNPGYPFRFARETEPERLLNLRAVQLVHRSIDEWLDFLEKVPQSQTEIEISEFIHLVDDYLLARSSLEVEISEAAGSGIRVLPPREARGLKARIVFITGLEQGIFPRSYINDWKVDIAGRVELKTLGIELETGSHYYTQEKMAFYWAVQSAVTRLILVFQDQDTGGQPLNRSIFLDEILEWVPDLAARVQHYPLAPDLPETMELCYSRYEKRAFTIRFTGRDPSEYQTEEQSRLEILLKSNSYRSMMGQIRSRIVRRAGPATPLFTNPASFQFIAEMFNPEHVLAITALEEYRSCPYRFFCKRILNVQPLLKPELTPSMLDLGSLYHQILEVFGDHYRDSGLFPDNAAVYQQVLEECFRDFYREWQENAATDLAQLMLLLRENSIRRNLTRWLDSELQWAGATRNRFRIKYLEFAFGIEKGDYDPASLAHPFQLGEGADHVKLWGKIDRVDVDAEGHFVVYDYKSGRGPSVKEILSAEFLQLPVYIMALEQLLFGDGTTAGGSYLGLKAPSRSRGGVWRRSQMPALSGLGVLDETQWRNWLNEIRQIIFATVRSIRSGEFHRVGEECFPFCEFRDVCRCEGWEVIPDHE